MAGCRTSWRRRHWAATAAASPRPQLRDGQEKIKQRALEAARQDRVVTAWQAAERELAGHRRDRDLARAEAEQLVARRPVLLAEGAGDLAVQLRDLDRETRAKQAELAEHEELMKAAGEVVKMRRETARQVIGAVYRQAAAEWDTALQKQQAELLTALASRVQDVLDSLANTHAQLQATGSVLLGAHDVATRELQTKLASEAVAPSRPTPTPAP
jgi:hypothetical protein